MKAKRKILTKFVGLWEAELFEMARRGSFGYVNYKHPILEA